MDTRPSAKRRRDIAALVLYFPIHFTLDVVLLNRLDLEGNAVFALFAANAVIAIALALGAASLLERLRSAGNAEAKEEPPVS